MRFERGLLKEAVVALTATERQLVLESIRQHAAFRVWVLHAAHVRSNHVHVVVESRLTPEKVMVQFKARASRALNESGRRRRKHWAYHGSTRYLWSSRQVDFAVDYVVNQQGVPTAVYVNQKRWEESSPECR